MRVNEQDRRPSVANGVYYCRGSLYLASACGGRRGGWAETSTHSLTHKRWLERLSVNRLELRHRPRCQIAKATSWRFEIRECKR
eukprot:scaffold473_cov189-Alexandrium_tamarense.AAC.33